MTMPLKDEKYFDVVLFSPPSRMVNHYRPPLGLVYLGGYLTHHGLRVKIVDVPLKEQIRDQVFFKNFDKTMEVVSREMIGQFRNLKTKVVGISCYTPEYFEVLSLAKAIKIIDPDVKIVVGGIHATFYPEDLLGGEALIDVCVLGEGEASLLDLHEVFTNKSAKNLVDIPGIAYYDNASSKVVLTEPRPLAQDLDQVSYPDYSLIDMEYYTNANPYAVRGCFLRSMYLLSSRGCPSQCTFCVAKKLRRFGSSGRFRSAENLLRELRSLKETYKIDGFYFIDDLFTVNKDNVLKFCRLLREEKLGLMWGCSSKVSTLSEELLKAMAAAGCVQIDFGVERGSDAALRLVKKGINVAMIKKIFGWCHRYGIRTFANMLVNLPQETEQDLQDVVSLVKEIKPEIVSMNIFTPYPGTEIYDQASYRFKKEEYPLLSKAPDWLVSTKPEKFRFAKHSVDLSAWVRKTTKQFNGILPNIVFYLKPRYWRLVLGSKARGNYFSQFHLLVKELILQKFS
jgi:anaerobic magnesium-protoporphyrin IX monomethyl ester cyclase